MFSQPARFRATAASRLGQPRRLCNCRQLSSMPQQHAPRIGTTEHDPRELLALIRGFKLESSAVDWQLSWPPGRAVRPDLAALLPVCDMADLSAAWAALPEDDLAYIFPRILRAGRLAEAACTADLTGRYTGYPGTSSKRYCCGPRRERWLARDIPSRCGDCASQEHGRTAGGGPWLSS